MNKPDHHIQPDYFLDALRTGGTFSKDFKACHGRSDMLPADANESIEELFPSYGGLAPLSKRRFAGADLVRKWLDLYTAEWIQSGIAENGIERPLARKLTATEKAFRVVKEYERQYSPVLIDWDDGLRRSTLSFKDRLTVAERSASAARLFFRPNVQKDLPADVHRAARIRADGIFHAFVEAPWRHQLGRCARCFDYFVLKIRPRKTYLRGMHCVRCKNVGSAEASAKARREAYGEKLLDLAVKAWRLYRPSSEAGERNKWIAKQVNSWLEKGEKKIQRNWITRHESEILAEVERVTHAKA